MPRALRHFLPGHVWHTLVKWAEISLGKQLIDAITVNFILNKKATEDFGLTGSEKQKTGTMFLYSIL